MTARLGTAAWADPEVFERTFPYRDGAVWLGRLESGAAVGYGDDRHVCLVSGSRSGKGTSSIVNNLCLWPGSVVVVDPRGENATITAARRGRGSAACEGLGQSVRVLDPFRVAAVADEYRARFNPLDALDPAEDESIDEAARLADALVVVDGHSKDPFWDESARSMVKGLILHVLTAPEYEGRRSLLTVRSLITRGDWQGVTTLREEGEENIPSAHGLLWSGVSLNPAFSGVLAGIGDSFSSMLRSSPKQFESVLQVANRNTEFIDSPAMQRCLEASDFRLSELKTRREGLSLYLSLPQHYMSTHYRWLRMLIALTVTEMQIVRGQPASGHRILMVLDEFAGLKRMEIIENAVAQIAGFGVKLFFVLQSLEQLKATYKDNWETFLSNAGLKIFFGIEDNFSREYVSKLVGETEIVREVRSESENVSESESVSESRSESFGQSDSRSHSVSGGSNRSVSRSESHGVTSSTSRSKGGSLGISWQRKSFLGPRENVTHSGGQNWSTSRSTGTSRTTGISHTEGTSEGWSDSATSGASRTIGTTTGTTRGTSRGTTAGTSETVHRRALVSPDEVGQLFARVDDRDHPAFPGLALVLIAGRQPAIVRRVNYYEDAQFIGRFDPHPDHPQRELVLFRLHQAALRPHLQYWPALRAEALVAVGDEVGAGQPLFRMAAASAGGADIRSPFDGRIHNLAATDEDGTETLAAVLGYRPDSEMIPPLAELDNWCARTNAVLLERVRKWVNGRTAVVVLMMFYGGLAAMANADDLRDGAVIPALILGGGGLLAIQLLNSKIHKLRAPTRLFERAFAQRPAAGDIRAYARPVLSLTDVTPSEGPEPKAKGTVGKAKGEQPAPHPEDDSSWASAVDASVGTGAGEGSVAEAEPETQVTPHQQESGTGEGSSVTEKPDSQPEEAARAEETPFGMTREQFDALPEAARAFMRQARRETPPSPPIQTAASSGTEQATTSAPPEQTQLELVGARIADALVRQLGFKPVRVAEGGKDLFGDVYAFLGFRTDRRTMCGVLVLPKEDEAIALGKVAEFESICDGMKSFTGDGAMGTFLTLFGTGDVFGIFLIVVDGPSSESFRQRVTAQKRHGRSGVVWVLDRARREVFVHAGLPLMTGYSPSAKFFLNLLSES